MELATRDRDTVLKRLREIIKDTRVLARGQNPRDESRHATSDNRIEEL